MSDLMRPVPIRDLVKRIFLEYKQTDSVFGIHEDDFSIRKHRNEVPAIPVFRQNCSMPVGPAAGPHTQLAQNIITAFLAGGRFFELKTVQKLDQLEIEKPCIDARDEAYNVEWSTEFTLDAAYREYVKAWIILHLLEAVFAEQYTGEPSFIFNMSVGYDLEGIRTEKMQRFIDGMADAAIRGEFSAYIDDLREMLADTCVLRELFSEAFIAERSGLLRKRLESISPNISPSLTLSTMHGCPPEEIEQICAYMLEEKQLDTFVKLNPTLLGYDRVRTILDRMGYSYLQISRETFDHDLQFADAVEMLRRLSVRARKAGRGFGVKLSNTLASVNDQGVLPGEDMYMSGRALYPLTIQTAAALAEAFDGKLPISYSGGVNVRNIRAIAETGIRPITAATELLKPAGYLRLADMAAELESCTFRNEGSCRIDTVKLRKLAESALEADYVRKEYRGEDRISTGRPLPMTDCYIAPCRTACPVHQDVPEYIYLVGQKRYAEALDVIYRTNPLPHITGYICDHQCMYNCTRLDYEGAVEIREMKRIAAERGFTDYLENWKRKQTGQEREKSAADGKHMKRAAVVGAGPAGLAAAYFLARAGFSVTVFEREADAGGVVRNIIPHFRLPLSAVEKDVEFISALGAEFRFNAEKEQVTIEQLRGAGFSAVFYAVGAEKDNKLRISDAGESVRPSLAFLSRYKKEPEQIDLGRNVLVVGGGNTAMDSARAAMRVPGVETVNLIYRRSENEMPADREEYEEARKDGVNFQFLANPEAYDSESGRAVCRVMKLGEPDASGRRRPVETPDTFELSADTIITAVGEKADSAMLQYFGLKTDERGMPAAEPDTLESSEDGVYLIGDVQSGPSTVVECIAAARKAADAAAAKFFPESTAGRPEDHEEVSADSSHGHAADSSEAAAEQLEADEQAFFREIAEKKRGFRPTVLPELLRESRTADEEFAEREAARCLECSYICNKCAEVCPNRANIAVDVRGLDLFADPFQIIHIDGFCNECGNCTTFCPWEGRPYRDKFTLFSSSEDMENSENSGFLVRETAVTVRYGGTVSKLKRDRSGLLENNTAVPTEISELINLIITEHPYLLLPLES